METEFQSESADIHGNEFHDMDTGKVSIQNSNIY